MKGFSNMNATVTNSRLPCRIALISALLCCAVARAEDHLGDILDAGARKLSAEDFKQQIVGRTVAGATPSGYEIDVFYHDNGRLIGGGRATPRGGAVGGGASFSIEGSWTIDPSERSCTRISVRLPAQCQFWFKRGNDYFLADSDWDRDVRVTRRTLTHK